MKVKVNKYTFDYPDKPKEVSGYNCLSKQARADNIQQLSKFKRLLCRVGMHDIVQKRKTTGWVIVDTVNFCSRCGYCSSVSHVWNAD